MNQFVLTQGSSDELRLFPHIIESGVVKNSSVNLHAFPKIAISGAKFFYVLEGKFQVNIQGTAFTLYPGDIALILPGQEFGSNNEVLEIGSFTWLHIEARLQEKDEISLDKWSSLSGNEIIAMSKILFLSSPVVITRFNEARKFLKCIHQELFSQEIGLYERVNYHIDELFIQITRGLARQNNPGRDFAKTFIKLEETLRTDLSRQWTVDEMAALVGLGNTLFNEKVKSYSGFSPLNYLINIRISEAIKLLKNRNISITEISLETGFYSSQHFSTTFKKLTGFTPGEFRKNNSYT
jgi:AraC-like DNA-binding protein